MIHDFQIDPKGKTVIAGFEDGVVRVMTVEKHPEEIGRRPQQEIDVGLKQVFKPHKNKVAAIAIDSKGEIFVSGVSKGLCFFSRLRILISSLDIQERDEM